MIPCAGCMPKNNNNGNGNYSYGVRKWKCQFCLRPVRDFHAYRRHMDERLARKCRCCQLPLCFNQVQDHMTRNHYFCRDCGSSVSGTFGQWCTDKKSHDETRSMCNICQEKYCGNIRRHLDANHYYCKDCHRWFLNAGTHPAKKQCPFCDTLVCQLTRHLKRSHYYCNDCNKGYPDQKAHPEKVECNVCHVSVCDLAAHKRYVVSCQPARIVGGLDGGPGPGLRLRPPFVTRHKENPDGTIKTYRFPFGVRIKNLDGNTTDNK